MSSPPLPGPRRRRSLHRRGSSGPPARIAIALALALAFGLIGCEDESLRAAASTAGAGRACPDHRVRMGVAASLREIAETLPRAFAAATPSVEVETSFGASSALARQVELGAPIDVLVSADADLMQALATQARVVPSSIRQIATGRLVLVSRAGSPFETSGLEAFRSPRLKRVGLPSQAVPLGRYGYAWLETIGMLDVLRGKIVSTENARANLTAVDQGHVDLAILYETDFRLRPSLRVVSRPDERDHPAIRYVAARTTRAPDCNEIDRVLDAWQSPRVRARLAEAGFGLPEEPRPARTRAAAPDADTPSEAEHR